MLIYIVLLIQAIPGKIRLTYTDLFYCRSTAAGLGIFKYTTSLENSCGAGLKASEVGNGEKVMGNIYSWI